jgi:hypothetical protein
LLWASAGPGAAYLVTAMLTAAGAAMALRLRRVPVAPQPAVEAAEAG